MAANSIETQARHDVQELKKGTDHGPALKHFVDQAHTMSSKDLKTEQNYWNTVAKSAHDNLPGLTIHKNKDGNVDSVKQGDTSIYDRAADVQKTVDNSTGALKKGQGPFQAFKDAGLSDREASLNAKAVVERTGRNSFKAGEKLGVHSDGSVTTTTEHNGVSTEERYNQNKTRETKVTQPNGDYSTTYKKADGSVDHSIEHTTMNGSTFESKKNPDGKVTETSRLDADGKLTTTKFQENGNASEKTVVANGVSTTTKFQENGATPTEKIIAQDGKTLTRKYAPNGIDTTETIEKGADGLSTTTKFDTTTKQKTEEHKEKANGYVDTTFKNGKEVQKTDRTYGPNDSYTEIQTTAKTPQGADERISTRHRGETGPDGKYQYTEKNRQGGTADDYDMTFDKDGKNGVGTRSRQTGGRGGSHTVNEYYYNGTYSQKAPPNQAQ